MGNSHRSKFDIANYFFFSIYALGVLALLLPFLPPGLVPFDMFLVVMASPVLCNFTLIVMLIPPMIFFAQGWREEGLKNMSSFIGLAYFILYGIWLIIPGGTTPLADGSLLFNKPIILFVLAFALVTIVWLEKSLQDSGNYY